MPPSSLHLLISENEDVLSYDDSSDEDSSDEDEDTATATADEDSTEANDADAKDDADDLFPMAKTVPKKKALPPGEGRRPRRILEAERPRGRPSTLTPPRGRSRAPPPKPCAAAARYSTEKRASTPMPTTRRTRSMSCSTRGACPPRMPSPRSPSYLEGRH